MDEPRRPPTAAEARALGHPLRLRILFACRDRARTNKQLAEALGTTPGTIHYHLRQLVEQGFLVAEPPRPGPRGSTEQPYRSTGKSWQLAVGPDTSDVIRQVGTSELLGARPEDVLTMTRLGLALPSSEVDELVRRLGQVAEEFAARSRRPPSGHAGAVAGDDAEAERTDTVTLFLAVHRSSPEPAPPS